MLLSDYKSTERFPNIYISTNEPSRENLLTSDIVIITRPDFTAEIRKSRYFDFVSPYIISQNEIPEIIAKIMKTWRERIQEENPELLI